MGVAKIEFQNFSFQHIGDKSSPLIKIFIL